MAFHANETFHEVTKEQINKREHTSGAENGFTCALYVPRLRQETRVVN